MTTGVKFRSLADTGDRHFQTTYLDQLFDVGLKGEMENLAIISRIGSGNWVSVTLGTMRRAYP
jgi:hypothetical protein